MNDGRHLSDEELEAAQDPSVGDGSPETAPERPADEFSKGASWKPTRKWIAARVVAVAGIATMYVVTNGWDDEETLAAITLASEAALSFLVPNELTPGGVPR